MGFAGTPEFAARALAAIHERGHTIALILTRPDRPFGRGLAVGPSPVKRYATGHALPLMQPASLRSAPEIVRLSATAIDVLVVAAYGLLLPPAVLQWPRHGCINIHASLLPRWRGAAPVARAIEAGDATTGISLMQMDAGLDTGPVIAVEALAIELRDTAGSLHDRLATLGARMIVDALDILAREGRLSSVAQTTEGATYAAKLARADTLVDWTRDAPALDRQVRSLAPRPGALARWEGLEVKLRAATVRDGTTPTFTAPGTVLAVGSAGLDVACGNSSVLRVSELQPASGRSMPAQAFAAGRGLAPGRRFEPGR